MQRNETAGVTWRLSTPSDTLFAYQVAVANDPRWWRACKNGLSPQSVIEVAKSFAAGVVISNEARDLGIAFLSETGAAGTGMLDIWSLQDSEAIESVSDIIPEILSAAFSASNIRALYFERFENDVDLLGDSRPWWKLQIEYPDFAMIQGKYENRTCWVLTRSDFEIHSSSMMDSEA